MKIKQKHIAKGIVAIIMSGILLGVLYILVSAILGVIQ